MQSPMRLFPHRSQEARTISIPLLAAADPLPKQAGPACSRQASSPRWGWAWFVSPQAPRNRSGSKKCRLPGLRWQRSLSRRGTLSQSHKTGGPAAGGQHLSVQHPGPWPCCCRRPFDQHPGPAAAAPALPAGRKQPRRGRCLFIAKGQK